jgi:hypothetical protein
LVAEQDADLLSFDRQALLLAFIAFMFWLSLRLGALGGEQGALSGIAGALERRGWMGPAQANGRAGEMGTPPIQGQTAADIAAKLKEKYGAEVVHAKRYVTPLAAALNA